MSMQPSRVLVNCDIGERGVEHEIDRLLLQEIDIANIACGGHAGDERSAEFFRLESEKLGIMVTAHLSYPDRANFGRKSIDIEPEHLTAALRTQLEALAGIEAVKFHGALYTDSCRARELAELLTAWLCEQAVTTVITMPGSALAESCLSAGITVLAEAFAERRYRRDPAGGRPTLVERTLPYASIHDLEEAAAQAERIILHGELPVVSEDDRGGTEHDAVPGEAAPIRADTVCIHSDSELALPLARRLRQLVGR